MILNIISLSFNSTIEMPQNFFGGGGGAPLCVAPPLLVGQEDFELMNLKVIVYIIPTQSTQ